MTTDMSPPEKRPVRLSKAPRIRRVYWCDFPKDAHKPEFWKLRPVVIISRTAKFYGLVKVVPFSTMPQHDKLNTHEMPSPFDKTLKAWAICNYIATVATSRLTQDRLGVPLVEQTDFDQIVQKVFASLPDRKRAAPKSNPSER